MEEVRLEDNKEITRALRDLRQKLIRSGKLQEMRKKEYYEKPSVARKTKRKAAMKRRHRARKQAREDWLP